LLSHRAFGQTDASQMGHAPQRTSQASSGNAKEMNTQEYITLLRRDVRHQKAEIMGAMMALDASDAAKFWPIYNQYDAELAKLNDARVANIKEYADNYGRMSDAKADELVQSAFKYRQDRMALLSKYYQRVKDAVGPIQAARFVQIEDQLLSIIDLQIASSLPVSG
jgi:hypothetical protein